MSSEAPHYEVGHMCAGCPFSNYAHTGCVVEESVKLVREGSKTSHQSSQASQIESRTAEE